MNECHEKRPRLPSESSIIPLCLLMGVAVLPPSLAAQETTPDSITTAEWREDLYYLEEELPRRHVNAFHTISPDRFERRLQRLWERVGAPVYDDQRMAIELAAAVNAIGDGHSGIRLFSDTAVGFHAYPIQLRVFPEGIHVIAAPEEQSRLVGARLDSVGDRSAEAALAATGELIARDNDMELLRFGPTLMTMGEVMEVLGVTDDRKSARFVFRKGGRRWSDTLRVDPAPFRLQGHSLLDRRPAEHGWETAQSSADSLSLWLQDPTNPYWVTWLSEKRGLYVQLNQVTDKSNESLAAFTNRVLAMADTLPAERLVLDLRWNRGGNGYLIRPLVRGIVKSEFDAEGRLYALIGRHTFSAGQMLVNELSRLTHVTYVGEPTAASPNMHGDNTKIVLPNSGLTVRAAYLYWQQRDPRDDRRCTVPHVSAPVTFADYREGRDPALEAALRGISRDGTVESRLASDHPSPVYDLYRCRYAAPRTGSIF